MASTLQVTVTPLIEAAKAATVRLSSPVLLRNASLPYGEQLARDVETLATQLNNLYSLLAKNTAEITSIEAKQNGQTVASLGNSGASSIIANGLANVSDPAASRTSLGLGSAATHSSGDFDPAGAAAASTASSLQKANNLSDLPSQGTARNNLGLGTAATQPTTAFDTAGAAAAAVSGLLASSNTWTGATQVFNSDLTIWGQINVGYAINWDTKTVFGTATFTNDMLFPYSNGFWYASPNASSWFEFRSITSQGAALANDYFGYQYNSRSTSGGADSWHDALQIASLTGLITFFTTVNFQNAPTFTDAATTRTNLGLGSAATQASTAFDAAGAATAVQTASLQKSANLSDLANAGTARTNLGLGTAAVANIASMPATTFTGITGAPDLYSTDSKCNLGVSWGNGLKFSADRLLLWGSGATYVAAADTGLARSAAGVLEVNSGTAGTRRTLATGGLVTAIRAVTAADTATTSDHTILGNITGAVTESLPATPLTGQEMYFVNVGSAVWTISGNGKNIWAAGASTASITLAVNAGAILKYDGVLWRRIV